MIRSVIRDAHKAGAKIGLCGQAPSDHPDFAEFLVECGIDSISVTPDSFIAVKQHVAEAESRRHSASRSASPRGKPHKSRCKTYRGPVSLVRRSLPVEDMGFSLAGNRSRGEQRQLRSSSDRGSVARRAGSDRAPHAD